MASPFMSNVQIAVAEPMCDLMRMRRRGDTRVVEERVKEEGREGWRQGGREAGRQGGREAGRQGDGPTASGMCVCVYS